MASLADIPFLSGYTQQDQLNRAQENNQLHQAGALQGLLARMQAAQQEQQLRGVMAQAGGDPAVAVKALLMQGTPKSIELATHLKSLMPKPAEPYTVGAGGQRFDANNKMVASVPPNPPAERFSNIYRLLKEKAALPPGDPRHAVYADAIRKESQTAKQISPVTHINNPAPVTPVTVQDPANPSETIVIDGRTKQVLGKGPKLTQTGSAEQKLSLGLPQAKLRVAAVTQNLDRLDSAMAELEKDPGLTNITGSVMGRTPNILNKATGAQAKLDSIKSQVFQSSLQAMRESSKTGGAVGNVSDREGDKLERTLAALDQAQGTADFKKQLSVARNQLKLSKDLIHSAFNEQFGGAQTTPTNGGWKVTPVGQ